jgi:hypothetical protein
MSRFVMGHDLVDGFGKLVRRQNSDL